MKRRALDNLRVLVTGASSGIGRALAEQLALHGAYVLVTARRANRLQELKAAIESHPRASSPIGKIVVLAGDIVDPEHRARLIREAQQRWDGLDVLVNNAGVGAVGAFSQSTAEQLRSVMEVNFIAAVELIRIALPLLRQSRKSAIVNVSSVLGHCAVPQKSEYCASKFALHGFSDALYCELRQESIDVLLVSPNTTRSEFFDNLLSRHGKAAVNPMAQSPEQVAHAIVKALRRGRRETILTLPGKMMVLANRCFPGVTAKLLSRFG